MDKIKAALAKNTGLFDPLGNRINVVKDVAAKMDVNPGAPLALLFSIILILTVYTQGWLIMITTITILYPSLKSIRAIQTECGEDDKVWLTYWMVFGAFIALETYIGFLLECIPYFHWIRLFFFIWLLLPYFNGSDIMYNKIMKPLLSDNQDKIQELIAKTKKAATEAGTEAARAASDPNNLLKAAAAASQAQAKVAEMTKETPKQTEVPASDNIEMAQN